MTVRDPIDCNPRDDLTHLACAIGQQIESSWQHCDRALPARTPQVGSFSEIYFSIIVLFPSVVFQFRFFFWHVTLVAISLVPLSCRNGMNEKSE